MVEVRMVVVVPGRGTWPCRWEHLLDGLMMSNASDIVGKRLPR